MQWHLAEILGEIPLDRGERRRAVEILKRNLRGASDWIVINDTMQTLAGFAAEDPRLRAWLLPVLREHRGSPRKAVAKRAGKLLASLETE